MIHLIGIILLNLSIIIYYRFHLPRILNLYMWLLKMLAERYYIEKILPNMLQYYIFGLNRPGFHLNGYIGQLITKVNGLTDGTLSYEIRGFLSIWSQISCL